MSAASNRAQNRDISVQCICSHSWGLCRHTMWVWRAKYLC